MSTDAKKLIRDLRRLSEQTTRLDPNEVAKEFKAKQSATTIRWDTQDAVRLRNWLTDCIEASEKRISRL